MKDKLLFKPVFEKIPHGGVGKSGCINVDVDTMAADLNSELCCVDNIKLADISWRLFMPRILKLFQESGIKATFFIIGKHLELPSCRENIKAIIRGGHEIANHTMNHRKHFSLLPRAEIEREVRECHDRIAELTGKIPIGFRAPGYVINKDVIRVLQSLGYKYDASLNISRFHYIVKAVYKFFIVKEKNFLVLQDLKNFPSRERVYWVLPDKSREVEAPLVLFPINIIPFVHYTFISGSLINFGAHITNWAYNAIRNRSDVLNFELHDIEFSEPFDVKGSGFPMPYLSSHYARIPMQTREEYFAQAFRLFRRDFRLTTFSDIIDEIGYEYSYR